MTDELWKHVNRHKPKKKKKTRPVNPLVVMFFLLSETVWPPTRELPSPRTMCWRYCSLWIFRKSINTGIHRILESFLNRCKAVPYHSWDGHKNYLKLKDVGQILEWEGREEEEGERREREQASAFMSFQCSLSHKGLLAEICRLWFFIEFWIGPIGGICLHKRETFG